MNPFKSPTISDFEEKMAKRYTPKIPKKPVFKRESYLIPETYSKTYEEAGIIDFDDQMMLFHVTQFGGFRLRRLPDYIQKRMDNLSTWLNVKKDGRFYSFSANPLFLSLFGEIEIQPLRRRWRNGAVNAREMYEQGFSDDEVKDSEAFLRALNAFYSTVEIGLRIPLSGISIEDRVHLSKFHQIPFLVKKPKPGGSLLSDFLRSSLPILE